MNHEAIAERVARKVAGVGHTDDGIRQSLRGWMKIIRLASQNVESGVLDVLHAMDNNPNDVQRHLGRLESGAETLSDEAGKLRKLVAGYSKEAQRIVRKP